MQRIIFVLARSVLFLSTLYSQATQKQIAVLNLSATGLCQAEIITLTDRLRSERSVPVNSGSSNGIRWKKF